VTRSANRWADLDRVWLREADGTWSDRGVWPRGGPLPAAGRGGSLPPSWINPALPQGLSVLIARRASAGGAAPTWLRDYGF
jgi:hypothetical protein